MKAAIIVLSDPKSGSEEALGRVFNALAAAYDFKQQGDEVTVRFQGAGELGQAEHPAHIIFEAVKDKVAGVSCGCADVFGGELFGIVQAARKVSDKHIEPVVC